MPSIINDRDHAVRVRDESGALRRVRAGAVVNAEGAFADNLLAAGLRSASSDEVQRYEAEQEARVADTGPASRHAAKTALGPVRHALRALTTVAPLQVVIGDDQAPYGPPTGTITTKQALASQGGDLRRAFGDHEALPGDVVGDGSLPDPRLATVPTGDQVHNAQAQASEVAQAVAESHIEGHEGVAGDLNTAVSGVTGDNVGGSERLSGDYGSANLTQLRAEASERGLSVKRGDGKDGDPVKADYVAALNADDASTGE